MVAGPHGRAETVSMVIAFICGGLGNQMFQYAMARRLARHRNVELKLDLSEYRAGADQRPAGLEEFRRQVGLYKLSVTAPAASAAEIAQYKDPYAGATTAARIVRRLRRLKPGFLWPATHFKEKQYRFDPAALELPGDVYVDGFWQSEKYFSDVADAIRAEFAPKDAEIRQYARQYVEQLRAGGEPGDKIISLHVRRGDLARAAEELNDARLVHAKPVSLDYISAAMARFGPECRFLVFSDSGRDIDWCKRNIPSSRLAFSEGHSDIQDMAIMSACDHHIIANSTFSWWAAWLDARPGTRVVAPKVWANPGAMLQMVPDDLVPDRWELL
jgi:glycosyl transferase family 11